MLETHILKAKNKGSNKKW